MRKLLIPFMLVGCFYTANAQTLKFENASPFFVKKEIWDKVISLPFTLEKAAKEVKISFKVDPENSSAVNEKDYSIVKEEPIVLNKGNDFYGKVELIIRTNDSHERHKIHITFKYKDETNKEQEVEYDIIITDPNNGGVDDPHYTTDEVDKNRNLSIEVFTGGNFDFFDKLKFQNIGGEFFLAANNITGKENRLGGFLGVSNFQNFTFDSSNRNVRSQNIRIDTGTYISGVTKYIHRTFIDHQKLSTNQWSYYINPTYRLNKRQSDFFNIYLSLRLEALRVSTKTEYITDTITYADTINVPLGNSAVFQSGKGFLLQKLTDVQTNGFFSIGFPMFLNAKDKFRLYFDPNLGFTTYTYSTYQPSKDRTSLNKSTYNITQPFYLFRLRVTEQFSGLNITIGGEIRGLLPNYNPTINAYLGIKANIVKWFSKSGGTSVSN